MYGLEGLREFPGDQRPQVRGRSDDVPLEHPEEPSLHYAPIPSPPPVPPVVTLHLLWRLLIEETNGRHQESLWVANGKVQQGGKRASVYPVYRRLFEHDGGWQWCQ